MGSGIQIIVLEVNFCGYGEIGSRAGFRYQWRNPWGFESLYPYQFIYGPVAQLAERGTLNP